MRNTLASKADLRDALEASNADMRNTLASKADLRDALEEILSRKARRPRKKR
jgi:hypothetical protein